MSIEEAARLRVLRCGTEGGGVTDAFLVLRSS